MDAPGHATAPAVSARHLLAVIGAAVLSGIGITLVTGWIITEDWSWFALGIATCLASGLLLFTRLTGPDSA